MTTPYAVLKAVIDGERSTLTADEAKAIHAALWDARSLLAKATATAEAALLRAATLDAECAQLVSQVLSEERRAAVLALEVATAREILRECVESKHNPRRARAKAAAFLLASMPAAP